MIVTRHRCTGWESDSLGESRRPTFAEPEEMEAFAFDPGGFLEPTNRADAAVESSPSIYFTHLLPDHELEEWDEWSVDGRRYLQDGAPARWRDPWPGQHLNGTVVKLQRRRG